MIKRSDRKLAAEQRATQLIIASRNTEKTTSDIHEDEEITFQKEIDSEFICKIQNEPSTSSGVSSSQMRKCIPTIALECDRTSVSDRAAARIASAVLKDFGVVSESEKSNVIDRSKIRRARKRQRNLLQINEKRETRYLQSVYFDGRKDRTMKMERRGKKYYRVNVVEEHIVLIEEPSSKYIGHVSPESGNSNSCAKSILNYLKCNADLSELIALGCDGTVTNTGTKGGILRLIELNLKRSLHWFICQLHGNELPLCHLFHSVDGRVGH